MTDYQQEEAPPVIGPGICQEIADRIAGHTLLDGIDPMTIFPMATLEDQEKLEGRLEGWYNLITQIGQLKSQPTYRLDPFNRIGLLCLRIEQYMLLLASPNCTQELKARYWADVVAAQNSQAEVVPTVQVTLTQSEYGENRFSAALGEVAKEPAYTVEGNWEQCIKRCTQFYRVRRWECSAWKAIMLSGDPIATDQAEGFGTAIAAAIDQQENDLIVEQAE